MYTVQDSGAIRKNLTTGGLKKRVGGTVLLLGTCSLLTDISSEMVSAILPLYLVFTLGFSPLQYGVVDGLYQGAAALINLASGYVGDRLRRPAPPQGRGGHGLRPLGAVQARPRADRRRVGRPERADPARPHRQGHPH